MLQVIRTRSGVNGCRAWVFIAVVILTVSALMRVTPGEKFDHAVLVVSATVGVEFGTDGGGLRRVFLVLVQH